MRVFLNRAAMVLAGLSLSACGGGGGGVNGFEAYNELFASTSGLSATPDVQMPSGRGTYQGFANLGINSAASNMFARAAVGEITLNVDFGGGAALSGSIRNFQYFDQAPVSGSVSISGGGSSSADLTASSSDFEDSRFALARLASGEPANPSRSRSANWRLRSTRPHPTKPGAARPAAGLTPCRCDRCHPLLRYA